MENQIPLSERSEKYHVHINLLYCWKKELFEGAAEIFSSKQNKQSAAKARSAERLGEKLQEKDKLIAELVQDNIELKKSQWRQLSDCWAEMDIRDCVVDYVETMKCRSEIPVATLIRWVGIAPCCG